MTRQGIAQLARQGRGGDSTLVHMRPDEVAGMQRMARRAGTSMTINPRTGLPEAFKLKDLFNINTYTQPVQKAAEQIGLGGVSSAISGAAKTLGQNAQYILPFIPGAAFAGLGSLGQFAASPMGRGLLAGGIGALSGGRPNLKRGLFSGLTAYGLSNAYQGLQAAGGVPRPGVFGGDVEAQPGGFLGGAPDTRSAADVINQAANEEVAGKAMDTFAGMKEPAVTVPQAPVTKPTTFMGELEAAGKGISNIAMGDKATADAAKKAFTSQFGKGAMAATYMGVSGLAALDEQEKYIREQLAQQKISQAEFAQRKARIDAARQRAEAALRANPYQMSYAIGGEISEDYRLESPQLGGASPDNKNVFGLAQGGSTDEPKMLSEDSAPTPITPPPGLQPGYAPMYAKGGMAARYIDGPGDGMSDSVHARIGGIQEARLADGEFVIPADVVSHIGNGSSKAGAKQLYAMMDRVRKARTGTTKQGKEINPTKLMPA